MDDKFAFISIMEALEMNLAQGFQPQRTIYLALGHDEEIGGHNGAAKIAELLRMRNIEFEYVLDDPLYLRPEDMKRLHGLKERSSVKDYAASVRFYYQLIVNSTR